MTDTVANLLVILSNRGDWKLSSCRWAHRDRDRRRFRCSLFVHRTISETGHSPEDAIKRCLAQFDEEMAEKPIPRSFMRIAQ